MADAGHGVVTAAWADGHHTFRLEWKHWFELQEKCACGPNEMLERLVLRKWRVQDVEQVVRLGLIGGGKTPVEALRLVAAYVHNRPLLESVPLAMRIVSASLVGPDADDEAPGEHPAAAENALAPSTSGTSMETAPSSGSPPRT